MMAIIRLFLLALSVISLSLAFQVHPKRQQRLQRTNLAASFSVFVSSIQEASVAKEESESTLYDVSTIRKWTQDAIYNRGSSEGLQALKQLKKACDQRRPFDFDSNTNHEKIQPVRQFFPNEITKEVSDIVKDMEADGCLSTNLDSVDGLPSFHLNLVSNGKPLFPKSKDVSNNAFGQNVQKLLDLVEPFIYNDLLPKVRKMGQSDHQMEVSDIFLRRYGQDGEDTRRGISAHYDVFSKVTAVFAFDNVAAKGNNGLYTTTSSENGSTISNHASLRQYFPLNEGDGVIHMWDVLHGVNVKSGSDRTSLIVWFTEKSKSDISPWLVRDKERLVNDDVAQFVLASALESAQQMSGSFADMGDQDSSVSFNDAAMFQSMSQLESMNSSARSQKATNPHNPQEWYLKSASRGNSFALSRIGSICEADDWVDAETMHQAQDLLSILHSEDQLPKPIQDATGQMDCQRMAWRYWLEGALQGNPSAQFSLADDLMVRAVNNDDDNVDTADTRLLAAVLFGLAAQQGLEDAVDRLARIVEMEVQNVNIHSERDFQQNSIVQTAQASMMASR